MFKYALRDREELLEELRVLGIRKKRLEDDYRLAINDITADVSVIKSELELLKSLGKIP